MQRALPKPTPSGAWDRFEREDLKRGQSRYIELLRELERRAQLAQVEPYLVELAAELATFSPHLSEEERAALTMLTLATLIDQQRGSTRTPVDGRVGYEHLRELYQRLSPGGAEALLGLSRSLIDRGGAPEVIARHPDAHQPLLYLDGHLCHQRLFISERRLAEGLLARLQSGERSADVEGVIGAVISSPPRRASGELMSLSSEQELALRLALSSPLTLISGGPGTGKTSIIVALLRAFARLGLDGDQVALAAPTGKAAYRMSESIREGLMGLTEGGEARDEQLRERSPSAQTLHRLLGYHFVTGRYRHHAQAPLEARVIIIDESSMIDTHLMERLILASPPDAQLILLGDADQLPSVAPGAVFRDLLSCAPERSVYLKTSYRMRSDQAAGRAILSFAQQIRDGEEVWDAELGLSSTWARAVDELDALRFSGLDILSCAPEERWRFIQLWMRRFTLGDERQRALRQRAWRLEGLQICPEQVPELDELFELSARGRILCLTRDLETGVKRVNQASHELYCKRAGVSYPFVVGEPVMVLHNDYERGLYNGDQGLVLWVELGDTRRAMVAFPELSGGYQCYELEALSAQLEHSYAMTVHKAQGSEFEHIALLLPAHPLPILSKELIYTAVTRSKGSVTIVGDGAMLSLSALRQSARRSSLQALLIEADKESDKGG